MRDHTPLLPIIIFVVVICILIFVFFTINVSDNNRIRENLEKNCNKIGVTMVWKGGTYPVYNCDGDL